MNDVPPGTTEATPEFILRTLEDEYRKAAQYDPEIDPSAALSFATTVEEWRDACDLVGWLELGRVLNAYWEIRATDTEWWEILEPAQERALQDVCGFLSDRVRIPRLTPRGSLGVRWETAASFLGIRFLLAAAGHDVPRAQAFHPTGRLQKSRLKMSYQHIVIC